VRATSQRNRIKFLQKIKETLDPSERFNYFAKFIARQIERNEISHIYYKCTFRAQNEFGFALVCVGARKKVKNATGAKPSAWNNKNSTGSRKSGFAGLI
jgi:hypothetical protein